MNSSLKMPWPAPRTTLSKPLLAGETTSARPIPNFLKVLIVDGDRDRGITNQAMINNLGHSVELAHDGFMALGMAAANRPDAVLLDIQLRCLDEGDVAGQLRMNYSDQTPLIIGFSTRTSSLVRRQCVEAGMDLVLEWPLNVEAIETVLLFECAKLAVEKKVESPRRPRQLRSEHPTQSRTTAVAGCPSGTGRFVTHGGYPITATCYPNNDGNFGTRDSRTL